MKKKRSERRKHCALPVQARSFLHLCTKFESDSSIRSNVIRGSKFSKLGQVTQVTPIYGSFYIPCAGGVCPPSLYQI